MHYRVPESIIDRDIGDELLIHRFETDDVFVLNGHARMVFRAVKEAGGHQEVREIIASEVFGDTLELYQAVDKVLEQMLAEGMIVREDEPPD